jgi:hypothetical protein
MWYGALKGKDRDRGMTAEVLLPFEYIVIGSVGFTKKLRLLYFIETIYLNDYFFNIYIQFCIIRN